MLQGLESIFIYYCIKSKGAYKNIFFVNIHILLDNLLCCGSRWLLGLKPTFSYWKDLGKTLWRKSWSAFKHLVRLKGMKDTLL